MTPLTLRAPEVRQLLATGEAEVVRPIKPAPLDKPYVACEPCAGSFCGNGFHFILPSGSCAWHIDCPFLPIGSERWCRESFRVATEPNDEGSYWCTYSADANDPAAVPWEMDYSEVEMGRIKAGSTVRAEKCPQWASRLTVTTLSVRAEQREGQWVWVAKVKRKEQQMERNIAVDLDRAAEILGVNADELKQRALSSEEVMALRIVTDTVRPKELRPSCVEALLSNAASWIYTAQRESYSNGVREEQGRWERKIKTMFGLK